jgi:hypothetical protein
LISDGLTLGAGGATFDFPAGMFQWTQGDIVGGTLTNAGTITTVDGAYVKAFLNGTLNNAGTFIQAGDSSTNLQFISSTINNSGTILQTGSEALFLSSDTALNNEAGGLIDLQSDPGISSSMDSAIVNAGTFRKSAGISSIVSCPFNNAASAVIDVRSGTLTLAAGGTSSGGNFTFANGATLKLNFGGWTSNYTGTYTGSGNGTVQLSSPYGTLTVGSGGATFNFPAGMFQWTDGTINGGPLTNTGTITLPGTGFPNLSTTVNNAGTIVETGSYSLYLSNGTVNNLAGGLYDLQSDAGMYANGGGGQVNNFGTFQKSGGTGTSDLWPGVAFTNNNQVLARQGTLRFSNYTQTAGDTRLQGGALASSTVDPLSFVGGYLDGSGDVFADVVNAGTVSPGGDGVAGQLTIHGNYTQTAAGTLQIDIGGYGQGTTYDLLAVTGQATLDGTLNVRLINAFMPNNGDPFQVLKFGSRSGDFATENLDEGNGLTFVPVYDATSLTLVAQTSGSTAVPPLVLKLALGTALSEPISQFGFDADPSHLTSY